MGHTVSVTRKELADGVFRKAESTAQINVIDAVDLPAQKACCQTLELVGGIRHAEAKRPVIVCSNIAAAIG